MEFIPKAILESRLTKNEESDGGQKIEIIHAFPWCYAASTYRQLHPTLRFFATLQNDKMSLLFMTVIGMLY